MEQSRSTESILQECLDLIENQGYKEITLLGQNIDAYGRDMTPKRTFADLLHYLNDNIPSKDVRIRYVTSHPRYFSDRVIDAVASLDKVCECKLMMKGVCYSFLLMSHLYLKFTTSLQYFTCHFRLDRIPS